MSTEEKGPESILDQVINEIRNEQVDPAQVRKAGERVWARVSQQAAGNAAEPAMIRNCADFQALFPAWREKRLSPARAMLLEDHIRECTRCRNALKGERVVAIRQFRSAAPVWRLALAASIVAAVGLGAWLVSEFAVPGGTGARATVYAMDGALYKVENGAAVMLAKNAGIGEAERVRTAKGGGAVLKLRDGSLVEMAERTEVSLSQRRQGVTIHLDRGAVIVQAAKQRNGRLYVATDDCTVSVKGTIFSVNHGLKGSRVSVIEGEVQVDQANSETRLLHPGDQAATSDTVAPVPVAEDFSWSRDFDKYLALMKDFAAIRAKLEAMPGPALRYSSRLLDFVPAGAEFYIAIPNFGQTVAEAHRLLQQQMTQSQALREWWAERVQSSGGEAQINETLDRVRAFSNVLGQEIVVALAPDAAGKLDGPLILAEVAGSGFRQLLEQEVNKVNAGSHGGKLRIIDDPFRAVAGPDEMLIYVAPSGIAAVAKTPAQLQAVARPAAGAFKATPFGARVAAAYQEGVSWLVCANLSAVFARENKAQDEAFMKSGFGDIRFLVAQRKEISGQTENRAELSFAQQRRGIASWLAPPAPIRALDYVSQDATFATAFAVKDPSLALDDLFQMSGTPDFWRNLGEFESRTGINVRNDLVAPLGGDIAIAVDGPVLPIPGFKVIAEVNDPARFTAAVEKMIAAVNREHPDLASQVKLAKEQVGNRTFWTVMNLPAKFEVHFTFDNGFLVAATTRDLVVRSLQYRATGYSLPKSAKFTALLPRDGHTNFSAMVYHALGGIMKGFSGVLTPEQQKALQAVASDTPTLVLAYGEQNRIEIASRGTMFGFRPEQLFGLPGMHVKRKG